MRRRLSSILKWTLTTLLALLLALEVASVWYTFSWGRIDIGPISGGEPLYTVVCIDRGAFLAAKAHVVEAWGWGVGLADGFECAPVAEPWGRANFAWWSFRREIPASPFVGPRHLPLTYPILALALPAAWLWFTDTRARRRRRAGRCRKCGYDLTGLPLRSAHTTAAADRASPICPECGAA